MGPEADTGETYDLIVAGAGISKLAAAYFFRDAMGAGAPILILDDHNDFGGHATRNEFRHGDRVLLSFGGTVGISTPSPYSYVSKKLIRDIGIFVGARHQLQRRGVLLLPPSQPGCVF